MIEEKVEKLKFNDFLDKSHTVKIINKIALPESISEMIKIPPTSIQDIQINLLAKLCIIVITGTVLATTIGIEYLTVRYKEYKRAIKEKNINLNILSIESDCIYNWYIPFKYKLANNPPNLKWKNIKNETRFFVVEVYDLEEENLIWRVLNIPSNIHEISANN